MGCFTRLREAHLARWLLVMVLVTILVTAVGLSTARAASAVSVARASSHSLLPCQGSRLTVTMPDNPKTMGVVMGGDVFSIWFANRGSSCALRGYPRLELWTKNGNKIVFQQENSTKTPMGNYGEVSVTLKRGATAAVFVWTGLGTEHVDLGLCASWLTVWPTKASYHAKIDVTRGLGICPRSYPSHTLIVSPYHPASVGLFRNWP
jgi:hypothetical protein